MGCSKGSSKSEVHSDTDLPQETRKISNNPILQLRARKRTNKTQASKRKEIMIRTKINKIEMKTAIEQINENRNWFTEKKNQQNHREVT